MDTIFHEKQEGQLCAQHCLNALLQGPFYTAVDLATLANQLDEEERRRMTEGMEASMPEYATIVNQPSSNMDDTGFFSVQVIARAISVWGLDLVSYSSSEPQAVTAKFDPASQNAFICNYREHWLTVRKLGNQWFNLNSLLSGPELISETYLGLFLTQLENDGYTVYIVIGVLPPSEADQVLSLQMVSQAAPPPLMSEPRRKGARSRPMQPSTEEEEFQRALALSLSQNSDVDGVDEELERALRLSEADIVNTSLDFDVAGAYASGSSLSSEEDAIQRAIQLSLQSVASPPQVSKPKESSEVKAPKPIRKDLPAATSNPVPSTSGAVQFAPTPTPTPAQKPPQAREPPKPTQSLPATQPNPVDMAGIGNRVGGGEATRAIRQSTPDADEVRRRRLAFLEKMQNNPKS